MTSCTDGGARLWDAHTGELQQTLLSDAKLLLDAVMSPDGKLVVTAGIDGHLRFWGVASGRLLWKVHASNTYVSGVHYEGERLISRSGGGGLARWELPRPADTPNWLARFERLVRCGPWRFDEATGTLVAQAPERCL